MERAKVLIFEDDLDWGRTIAGLVEEGGHKVVGLATDMNQALVMIEKVQKLEANVAVIDANLGDVDESGKDGQLILKSIKEMAPGVKTIGMSSSKVSGTDVDLGKFNAARISGVIDSL